MTFTDYLPTNTFKELSPEHDESQTVNSRSIFLEYFKQSLRKVYEKWEGAKDRQRALPKTRYPMFIATMLSLLGKRPSRRKWHW